MTRHRAQPRSKACSSLALRSRARALSPARSVCLYGSDFWEGTYFVFVEVHAPRTPGDAPEPPERQRALSSPRPVEEDDDDSDDEEEEAPSPMAA